MCDGRSDHSAVTWNVMIAEGPWPRPAGCSAMRNKGIVVSRCREHACTNVIRAGEQGEQRHSDVEARGVALFEVC